MLVAAGSLVLSGQQRVQRAKPPAAGVPVKKTELKIGKPYPDWVDWISAVPINQPDMFQFRWGTTETGVSVARWVITADKPYGAGGAIELKSGPLTPIPQAGKVAYFYIDFKLYLPKVGPQPPAVARYYVQVVPSAQGKDLAPSSTVLLTYTAAGPPQQFEEDMGMKTPTMAEAYLKKVWAAIEYDLKLQGQLSGVMSAPNLPAYQQFKTAAGLATIEVTEVTPTPTIYVSVPIPWLNDGTVAIGYHYFMYTVDPRTAQVDVHPQSDQFPPARDPFRIPVLRKTGDWANDGSYNTIPGDDPPHWTPILITSDAAKIADIHRQNQHYAHSPATTQQPKWLIDNVRAVVKTQDLTDRAMEPWQHVTLRGYVEDAGFPDGDLGGDHAIGYNVGDFTPLGPPCEMSDPDIFAGMDWDLTVRPDPAYRYLASDVRRTLKVEMEHFALGPYAYWPRTGQYVQTVGRWVTDNGHETYTEIHPAELYVSTDKVAENSYRYMVNVTGAWRGGEMQFVVNPPARPSPTAKLWYKVTKANGQEGYDRLDNCELIPEIRGAPGNPNHLLFRVRKTANATLVLHNTGVVGMTSERGMQAVVQVGWDETMASVQGTVRGPGGPAAGTQVFFRSVDGSTGWRQYPLDPQGRYAVTGLDIGKEDRLRPAGSGWNFANVPVKVKVQAGGSTVDFTATAETYPSAIDLDPRSFIPFGRKPDERELRAFAAPLRVARPAVAPAAAARTNSMSRVTLAVPVGRVEAPVQMIRSMLVSIEDPSGLYGVSGNALGYKERASVIFRLRGLVGADGTPIQSLSSAYTLDNSASPPTVTVLGTPTSGIAGAKVRVKLVLGNASVGYHAVEQVDTVTGVDGMAIAIFDAGRHVEDAHLAFEVLENPVNPWFLPKIKTSSHLFYPSGSGGDGAAGAKPYHLRVVALRDDLSAEFLGALGEDGQDSLKAAKFYRNWTPPKRSTVPAPMSKMVKDDDR